MSRKDVSMRIIVFLFLFVALMGILTFILVRGCSTSFSEYDKADADTTGFRETPGYPKQGKQEKSIASNYPLRNGEEVAAQMEKGGQGTVRESKAQAGTLGKPDEKSESDNTQRTLLRNPKVVGSWKPEGPSPLVGGSVSPLAVSGNYAYAILMSGMPGEEGFYVIDVSDPTNPHLAAFVHEDKAGFLRCIFVIGKYVYVGGTSGLHVVDVTDPKEPRSVAFYKEEGEVERLFVKGSYAYLALNSPGELQVVEISEQGGLRYAGACDIDCASDIFASDSYVYRVGFMRDLSLNPAAEPYETFGLQIIDVSCPEKPTTVATHLVDSGAKNMCSDVHVQGTHAYVLRATSLVILDVSDPYEPKTVGQMAVSDGRSLFVKDQFAYVGAGVLTQLKIVDISDPKHPECLRSFYIDADRIHVAGRYGYILNEKKGLQIVELFEDKQETAEENAESK